MILPKAGVEVVAMIDSREGISTQADYPIYAGAEVVATSGRLGLTSISICQNGGLKTIECDALGVSGGWNPSVHLTCHMNGRPLWDPSLASFLPKEGAIPGLVVAGAASGVMTTAGALAQGYEMAQSVAKDLGKRPKHSDLPHR